jgi:tetratricopeptide (TPR) repeat protein
LEAYERAVELDPGFAKAMVRLSEMSSNLGFIEQAEEHARRALEQPGRLSAADRLFAEGFQYAVREGTWDRAIQAFERAIELYPDYGPARLSLGYRNNRLERFEEAIEDLEILRHRRFPFVATYGHLAATYANLGRFKEGYRALMEYVERNPNEYTGHAQLGWHLVYWGKLDEALESFQKAVSIDTEFSSAHRGRWIVAVLREDLPQAEATAGSVPSPIRKPYLHHITRLYQGRPTEALTFLEEAIRARQEVNPSSELDPFLGRLHNQAAMTSLERGRWDEAIAQAKLAQRRGRGDWGEWWGLFTMAIAQAHLGRWEEATSTAAALRSKTERLPGNKEKRRYLHLMGELALIRGNDSQAVQELENAESMLPPRGFYYLTYVPKHVSLWFSLARAYLEAGDEEKAAEYFRRITESACEHVYFPIPYVRSFYFLAKIHENRGETEKAREYYRRFYDYWKDGDLDRDRVEEAAKKRDQA